MIIVKKIKNTTTVRQHIVIHTIRTENISLKFLTIPENDHLYAHSYPSLTDILLQLE